MGKSSKYSEKLAINNRQEVNPPEPLNIKQAQYIKALKHNPIVLSIGPPGTAKTFIPAALGAYWLHTKQIERVVIARPSVGPGKSIGLLPGDKDLKLENFMKPVTEAMVSVLGQTKFEYYHKKGQIEFCLLEAIQGRTFDDCLLILDEGQDIDEGTMKAVLTRIGENSTFIVNGDIAQQNIKGKSGLALAQQLATVMDIDVPTIEFTVEDIVRSGACASVVKGLIKLGHY